MPVCVRAALLALPVALLILLAVGALRGDPEAGSPRLGSDGGSSGRSGGGGSSGPGEEDGSRLFFQRDGTFRIMQITDLQ